MKKNLARELAAADVAASEAARTIVARVRSLDVAELRQTTGGGVTGAYTRQRNIIA